MRLDLPTLMFTGAFVSALCGAFLLFVWWQNRHTVAALCWAAGYLTLGLGVSLLAVGFAGGLQSLFMVGLTFLVIAPALIWTGVRSFNGDPVRPVLLGLGPLVWFIAIATVHMQGDRDWVPTVVNTLATAAYNGITVWELARHRQEKLRARDPLIVLIAINTLVLLLAIPAAFMGGLQSFSPPPIASLFGLIHFETIIYAIGTTVFLVMMMKERSEQKHLQDAQTDALTGLANRRAFLPLAERAAERCRRKGQPYAVVVFDLDRFKRVNDTFGHPLGDEVLRVFAKVARETLRPGDIVSRVGGEEFFAILPGTSLQEGCAVAERVRAAFAEAGIRVEGRNVNATLSAGVMASHDGGVSIATLLEKADTALYRAKFRGRNCVQCGLEEPEEKARPRLVRVA